MVYMTQLQVIFPAQILPPVGEVGIMIFPPVFPHSGGMDRLIHTLAVFSLLLAHFITMGLIIGFLLGLPFGLCRGRICISE